MRSVLLAACALWIAAGAGRLLTDRLTVLRNWPLERFVYAATLGLGAAAYGVFALGLCGLLSFWPVTIGWLLLALVGIGGMRANALDLWQAWRRRRDAGRRDRSALLPAVCAGVLVLCGGVAALACFQPPGGHEWDALAYHLADPKLFLLQHRLTSLPTEHHSNFPFTMEMLFAIGLLYDGYPLANLFHLLTAALTVLAMLAFCRRILASPRIGYLAAVIYATTPMVLWEASVAYIDIGLGLFTTLAAFAGISGTGSGVLGTGSRRSGTAGERKQEAGSGSREESAEPQERDTQHPVPKTPDPIPDTSQWMLLAGLMMGLALGTKYLALVPFALLGGLLAWRRVPLRALGVYAGVALAIGAPWYLKNILLVHNPVYPFFYRLFAQSRYWSADRAAAYAAEQGGFGYPHALTHPAESLRNLALIPWSVVADADRFANRGDYTFAALVGGLYSAFGFALLFLRRVPRAVSDLWLLAVLQVAAWFCVAQVGRYLISLLPLLAVASGYAAWRLIEPDGSEQAASDREGRPRKTGGLPAALSLLAIAGQVALLFYGVCCLPTSGREALERGLLPTALSAPEALTGALQPEEREERVSRTLDIYDAMQWINRNTPPTAGVVLYDETRGYYLDRDYLWGNAQHSAYIPYETLQDGIGLTAWLLRHGIQYALINLKFADQNGKDPELPQGAVGNELIALRRWYAESKSPRGTWQYAVGDALRRGLWTPEFTQYGVIVLRIEEPGQTSVGIRQNSRTEERAR